MKKEVLAKSRNRLKRKLRRKIQPQVITIILTVIVILFLGFLLNWKISKTYDNQNENLPETAETFYSCKTDSDCIKVRTTCCQCSMGGNEECLSVEGASYYGDKLKKECQNLTLCPAVFNCKIKSCKCVKGRCTKELE